MPIRTIEVVCPPCFKCEKMKKNIKDAIAAIELRYKIRISYELMHTPHLRDINKYGLNPSQIPAVLVNGRPEFGGIMEPKLIEKKLDLIHKTVA